MRGLPQMGKLKAYLFGFFASFYPVAAAWFSVGPVVEFARWVGLAGSTGFWPWSFSWA